MHRPLARRTLPFFILSAVALMASASALLEGKQLTSALSEGGYVIVMRHASSPPTTPTRAQVSPGNVGGERQLDEAGRESARAMGEALRKLQVKVGMVLSSTAYRSLETGRLAQLPDPRTYSDLDEAGRNAERTNSFRAQVAVVPDAGTDTVIITHLPNIADAFGSDAKDLAEGESLIYKPDGHGKAALVARVKIEEWPKLASSR